MLEIRGLKKSYGKRRVLDNFFICIQDGMLYGLVGPNGAGKTTLMRIVVGLTKPDAGTVMIDGSDVLADGRKIQGLVGYVPDSIGVYDNLTVGEYMEFFAGANGMKGTSARRRCIDLLGQVGLDTMTEQFVDSLSRGMQQRLCLARALINDPAFLVMDEPTSGLDPKTKLEFKNIIGELHEQGKTILLSSHMLSELPDMCTNLGIMDQGSMMMEGDMDDIMRRITGSNPIRISVLDGVAPARAILARKAQVKSISQSGKTFMVHFSGSKIDEAGLLAELIQSDIPVVEFVREAGNLEDYFMQITGHLEEKVVMRYDF